MKRLTISRILTAGTAAGAIVLAAQGLAIAQERGSVQGVIHDAYSRFWNYSSGNQLLAWFQCTSRKLDLGPINTFLGWIDCGRHVKKGEKALTLCMPVTVKRRSDERSIEPFPVDCHPGEREGLAAPGSGAPRTPAAAV